jgi:hypothetical protein
MRTERVTAPMPSRELPYPLFDADNHLGGNLARLMAA